MTEDGESRQRLAEVEETLEAFRREDVDAVVESRNVLALRLREVEAKLNESNERMRALLRTSAREVWEVQVDNDEIENALVREYADDTPGEWTRRNWLDAVHPDDRESVKRQWQEAIDTRCHFEIEVRTKAKSGWRWTNVRVTPLLDGSGRVRTWVGMNADITDRKEIELALRMSEERSRRAQRIGKVGVWEVDANTGRTSWSDTMWELFGHSPDSSDDPNEVFQASLYCDDRERVRNQLRAGGAGEPSDFCERFRIVRPDGTLRWIESFAQATGCPESLKMFNVSIDITERVQYESKLAETNAVLETLLTEAPVGFAYLDTELRYRLINDRLAAINGIPAAAHIGKRVHDVVPAVMPEFQGVIDHVQSTGEPVVGHEFNAQVPDESAPMRFWRQSVYPIADAHRNTRGFGVMVEEISDRKRAEEELYNTDRRKEEFLRLLGHELRNLLSPLCAMLDGMKHENADTGLPEETAAVMEAQLGHMERLVDDLLDVSRINRGTIELCLQDVALAPILEQSFQAIRPLCTKGNRQTILVVPPEPIRLQADPTRLVQVLNNLLHNAVKFTREGGRIELRAEREHGCAIIRVRDDGIGIPPDELQEVFASWGGKTSSYGGLGLGLVLAKNLVEAHGGSVEAHSDGPGHGAEFIVRLPIVPPTSEAHARPHVRSTAPHELARPLRVLIVDDNAAATDSLAMLVKISGHEVHTAYGGAVALRRFQEIAPDVIVLDLNLPDMSGQEVAHRIRQQQRGRDVLIIVITGWNLDSTHKRATDFDVILRKPVKYADLEQLLQKRARALLGQRGGS